MGSSPCPASVGALTPLKQGRKQTKGERVSTCTSALVFLCLLEWCPWQRPWKQLVPHCTHCAGIANSLTVPHLVPAVGWWCPARCVGRGLCSVRCLLGSPGHCLGFAVNTAPAVAQLSLRLCRRCSTNKLIEVQENLKNTFENKMRLQWVFQDFMLWDVKSLVSTFF